MITFWHDYEVRTIAAPSFGAWLTRLADDLEQGVVVATESQNAFFSIIERSALTGSLASLHVRGESEDTWRERVHAAAWSSPSATAVSLVDNLRKHHRLRLKPGALAPMLLVKLHEAIAGLHASPEARARKVWVVLSHHEDIAELRLTEAELRRVLDLLPFVDDILAAR